MVLQTLKKRLCKLSADFVSPLTNEEDEVSDVPEPSDAVAISDGGGSVLTILDLKAWLRNPWKAI